MIYQSRETVFHRDSGVERSIFDEIRGVWIADTTLSRVNISIETKTREYTNK